MKTYTVILADGTHHSIQAESHDLGSDWLQLIRDGQVIAAFHASHLTGFTLI